MLQTRTLTPLFGNPFYSQVNERPSYSTHAKTNFTSDTSTPAPFVSDKGQSNVNPTYTTNFGSQRHHTAQSDTRQPAAAQNYSFNNGATTTAYKSGSGGLPLNQATYIQTSHSPTLHPGGVSPGGTKVPYRSPSPRTRNELSPYASVQHLQYNSPMNIYSVESAAEQYTQQTGRPTE
ncbi:unnamed protein product [Strongylus vulgaris]|uniref:Zasp-like motif domain-containing protein n=1 Tax=Strongylus vulgaris TaxID=40348 RepID=A0A3P7L4R5_STRVU|nr:unnamed protein product [Strongylus vulgaris]